MKRPKPTKTVPMSVRPEDVFATFVAQASSLGQELAARRRFDDQVSEYLKDKGLVDDFEDWRGDRYPEKT